MTADGRRARLPRPASRGWWILVLSLGLVLAGAQLERNAIALLGCFGVGLLIGAFHLAGANLRRLSLRRRLPHPVHAGSAFTEEVTVTNHGRILPAALLVVREEVTGTGLPAGQLLGGVAGVGPRSRATLRLTGKFFRRGEKRFGGAWVESCFPLGLFRTRCFLPCADTLIVYPRVKVVRRNALPSPDRTRHADLLPAGAARLEMDFAGLREYRPGDNPRWIHWRTSARFEDILLVREFESAAVRRVRIELDPYVPAGRRRRLGVFERAVGFAASLSCELIRRGYTIDFRIRGVEKSGLTVDPHNRSLHALYRILALIQPADAPQEGDVARGRGAGTPRLCIEPTRLSAGAPVERAVEWR